MMLPAILTPQPGGGFGLGEPWDSLIKGAGTFVILVLVALWRKFLYLPGVVDDLRTQLADERAEHVTAVAQVRTECDTQVTQVRGDAAERLKDMRSERDRLLSENKEMTTWLQTEAIPLVSRSTAVIEKLTDIAPQRGSRAR